MLIERRDYAYLRKPWRRLAPLLTGRCEMTSATNCSRLGAKRRTCRWRRRSETPTVRYQWSGAQRKNSMLRCDPWPPYERRRCEPVGKRRRSAEERADQKEIPSYLTVAFSYSQIFTWRARTLGTNREMGHSAV